jgi:hypothetical protein
MCVFEWNHKYIPHVFRPKSTCAVEYGRISDVLVGGVWLGGHKMQIPEVMKNLFVKVTTWIRIAIYLEYRPCNFVWYCNTQLLRVVGRCEVTTACVCSVDGSCVTGNCD